MQISNYKIVHLDEDTEFHRYVLDGKSTESGNNQFVTQIAAFTTRESDKIILIDELYCGVNNLGVAYTDISIELNIYSGSPGDQIFGDTQTPLYPQSIPVGFNQGAAAGTPEPARWTQFPKTWAGAGETIQVCVRVTASATDVPVFTVQFRKFFRKIRG